MEAERLPNGDSNYPFRERLLALQLFVVIIFICFIYCIIVFYHFYGSYWRKRKVPHTKRKLCGDITTPAGRVLELYEADPNSRYFGFYNCCSPILLVKDPDLIRDITTKNHSYFHDHVGALDDSKDPLWDKNLFALKGEKWKKMRTTLSPAFTGNRLRDMFGVISQTAIEFQRHFLDHADGVYVIDVKDTFTRYTNDVIATAAFGVKVDSLRKTTNEFYMMAKEATDLGGFWQTIKFIFLMHFPLIAKLLRLGIFTKRVRKFFTELVVGNIRQRVEQKIVRLDMLHLLLQARKGKLKAKGMRRQEALLQEITDIDITAQALIFFFAGFDTVSSLICFMCYELAVNPEIQKKLLEEIDRVAEEAGEIIDYDSLASLEYMRMVIDETLRKYPNNPSIDRVCTSTYTIAPKLPGEKEVILQKGNIVWFPVYAMHHDPKYFPQPKVFNPERFSRENRENIKPYTYMPFGNGPRTCIGSRFAIMETKVLFFHILLFFEIVTVAKTDIPVGLSKRSFNTTPEYGCFLGFKQRRFPSSPP